MKFSKLSTMAFAICASFSVQTYALAQSSAGTTQAALDAQMTNLQERAILHRKFYGWTGIGMGVGFGIGAIVAANSENEEINGFYPWLLGVPAVVVGGIGGFTLAVPGEVELSTAKYLSMPSGTPDEISNKIAWGESYFESLSEATRSMRFKTATVSTVSGAGYLALYSVLDSENRSRYAILLYGGIAFLGLGIADYIFPTTIENEYKSYKAWKQGQSKDVITNSAAQDFHFSVLPKLDGFTANLSLSF